MQTKDTRGQSVRKETASAQSVPHVVRFHLISKYASINRLYRPLTFPSANLTAIFLLSKFAPKALIFVLGRDIA